MEPSWHHWKEQNPSLREKVCLEVGDVTGWGGKPRDRILYKSQRFLFLPFKGWMSWGGSVFDRPNLLKGIGKSSGCLLTRRDRELLFPSGKGEAVRGRSSFVFSWANMGRLPIETLPLYFRKLPKSLEENNVFPLQPPRAINPGLEG